MPRQRVFQRKMKPDGFIFKVNFGHDTPEPILAWLLTLEHGKFQSVIKDVLLVLAKNNCLIRNGYINPEDKIIPSMMASSVLPAAQLRPVPVPVPVIPSVTAPELNASLDSTSVETTHNNPFPIY